MTEPAGDACRTCGYDADRSALHTALGSVFFSWTVVGVVVVMTTAFWWVW